MLTFRIHTNHIAASLPDSDGARTVTIEAMPKPAFEGDSQGASAFLQSLPIGQSVEARAYRNGKFAGCRSCMNKPALWAYVESFQ